MAWFDSTTGLNTKFGTELTTPQAGGEIMTQTDSREIEFSLTLTAAATGAAIPTGCDNIFFPTGVRIEQVEIIVDTAATSGGSAVLNIGLQRLDRSTELDYDGFVAAATLASMNAAGKKIVYNVGSTSAGALIGTTLANPGYLTFDYDTAAFTAGVIRVRVKYYKI